MIVLNDRYCRFVEEYTTHLDAHKAALAAGYRPKSAKNTGSKLLQKEPIREKIKEIQMETSKNLQITKEEIIQDLIEIKNTQKNKNTPAAINAIKVINQMLGYNEATNIKVEGSIVWNETKQYKDDTES